MTITKVENIESSDDIKSNDDGPRNGTIEINERNVENEDEAIEQLSNNFSRRVGLRTRKPIKYTNSINLILNIYWADLFSYI